MAASSQGHHRQGAAHRRPDGYDDEQQGWTGGYATRNANTGAVYLNCEYTVLEGKYARHKLCSLIGLMSPKALSGPTWAGA